MITLKRHTVPCADCQSLFIRLALDTEEPPRFSRQNEFFRNETTATKQKLWVGNVNLDTNQFTLMRKRNGVFAGSRLARVSGKLTGAENARHIELKVGPSLAAWFLFFTSIVGFPVFITVLFQTNLLEHEAISHSVKVYMLMAAVGISCLHLINFIIDMNKTEAAMLNYVNAIVHAPAKV